MVAQHQISVHQRRVARACCGVENEGTNGGSGTECLDLSLVPVISRSVLDIKSNKDT